MFLPSDTVYLGQASHTLTDLLIDLSLSIGPAEATVCPRALAPSSSCQELGQRLPWAPGLLLLGEHCLGWLRATSAYISSEVGYSRRQESRAQGRAWVPPAPTSSERCVCLAVPCLVESSSVFGGGPFLLLKSFSSSFCRYFSRVPQEWKFFGGTNEFQ